MVRGLYELRSAGTQDCPGLHDPQRAFQSCIVEIACTAEFGVIEVGFLNILVIEQIVVSLQHGRAIEFQGLVALHRLFGLLAPDVGKLGECVNVFAVRFPLVDFSALASSSPRSPLRSSSSRNGEVVVRSVELAWGPCRVKRPRVSESGLRGVDRSATHLLEDVAQPVHTHATSSAMAI